MNNTSAAKQTGTVRVFALDEESMRAQIRKAGYEVVSFVDEEEDGWVVTIAVR